MINITLYILIFLTILLLYFHMNNTRKEGFINDEESLYNDKYYGVNTNYDDIYDDFYSFYHDEMFFSKMMYDKISRVILNYVSNVYNNHLVVGIKHGGHINQYLDKLMPTLSTSPSNSLIKKCKYNYSDHNYSVISDYSHPLLFNANEFTHISILDDEIYYSSNIIEVLDNCSKWLMFKGKLFIQTYDSKSSFKENIGDINLSSNVVKKYVYTSQLKEIDQNNYTWIEQMKLKNTNKTRKNIHSLTYYDPQYIENICQELGLIMISKHDIINNISLLVFEKQRN